MIPSVETRMFQAIKAHVETLPMAGVGKAYDLVWTVGEGSLQTGAGAAYTPTPNKPYLRVTWTPNTTQRLYLGSDDPHRRPGVLQIDVFDTKTRGTGVARETAGQVAAHFAADTKALFQGVKVQVTKAPSIRSMFVDTHIQCPVDIEIEAFA